MLKGVLMLMLYDGVELWVLLCLSIRRIGRGLSLINVSKGGG